MLIFFDWKHLTLEYHTNSLTNLKCIVVQSNVLSSLLHRLVGWGTVPLRCFFPLSHTRLREGTHTCTHSPFISQQSLMPLWSALIGSWSSDFRLVMEVRCPPWGALPAGLLAPNWGLVAPAGRSGGKSCVRGLDITSGQEEVVGGWGRGEARGKEVEKSNLRTVGFKIKTIQLVILIDRRAVQKKRRRKRCSDRWRVCALKISTWRPASPPVPWRKKRAWKRDTYHQIGTMLMSLIHPFRLAGPSGLAFSVFPLQTNSTRNQETHTGR